MTRTTNLALIGLPLAIVLASAAPALPQPSPHPGDPAVIRKALERSAELQRQALQALADPGKTERLVKNAWKELKFAQDNMVQNSSTAKFPDPLFASNNVKVGQALALLLGASDELERRARWTEQGSQIQGVRNNVEKALRLTSTVLVTAQ